MRLGGSFHAVRSTRFISTLLCLALVVGNAASLQVIAWIGMVTMRTAEQGLSAAVSSTFSGRQPCRLCRAAAAFNQVDNSATDPTPTVKKAVKVDLIPPIESIDLVADGQDAFRPRLGDERIPRTLLRGPEPPPPRRV